jgi:hypothetical protein
MIERDWRQDLSGMRPYLQDGEWFFHHPTLTVVARKLGTESVIPPRARAHDVLEWAALIANKLKKTYIFARCRTRFQCRSYER